jgi:hypothetical protein
MANRFLLLYRRMRPGKKYRAESIQVVSLAEGETKIKTLTSFYNAHPCQVWPGRPSWIVKSRHLLIRLITRIQPAR